MNIRITKENVVIAKDFRTIDFNAQNKIRGEISQTCKDFESTQIVVDHRGSRLQMSYLDQYAFGKSFWESGIQPTAQITVLLSEDHPDKEDLLFSITVAHNRGSSFNLEEARCRTP
jgi:hypothetical protein